MDVKSPVMNARRLHDLILRWWLSPAWLCVRTGPMAIHQVGSEHCNTAVSCSPYQNVW